jgi:MoxR-like ATPase
VAGTASALLVSGEAGVGKTVLVRQVANHLARSAEFMLASCLSLTSLAVPLLPLLRRSIDDGLLHRADPVENFPVDRQPASCV